MAKNIKQIIFEELLNKPIKKDNFYQFISGVIRGCGILTLSRKQFTLTLEHKSIELLQKIKEYVNEIYKYEVEEETEITNLNGNKKDKKYTLEFDRESSKNILIRAEIFDKDFMFLEDFSKKFFKGSGSAREYLSGLYLACGNIRIPEKTSEKKTYGYTLSFNLNSQTAQDAIINLISKSVDIPVNKIFKRSDSSEIYIKDSECITNFFAYLECNNTMFTLLNFRLDMKIKNDANRAKNADLANIDRQIDASKKQIDAIKKLIETKQYEKLSDELKETCNIRINNPDLDLTQLGQMFNPPISKSCINHRLRRLIELANKVENK